MVYAFLSRFLSLGVVVVLVGLMPDIAGIDPSQSILRAVRVLNNC
ncbi:oligopeptide transport system permease protein OppB [Vibrio sp. JCM 19052]|nr:oligopeptide transport system permease protein OppB [Vibrio sp. JCM 19052]